ncbi:hypothetical protein ACFL96_15170 [Thermoproteota archaeon]
MRFTADESLPVADPVAPTAPAVAEPVETEAPATDEFIASLAGDSPFSDTAFVPHDAEGNKIVPDGTHVALGEGEVFASDAKGGIIKNNDGEWELAPGHIWVNSDDDDDRSTINLADNHLVEDENGMLAPAPGYDFKNDVEGDYTVVKVEAPAETEAEAPAPAAKDEKETKKAPPPAATKDQPAPTTTPPAEEAKPPADGPEATDTHGPDSESAEPPGQKAQERLDTIGGKDGLLEDLDGRIKDAEEKLKDAPTDKRRKEARKELEALQAEKANLQKEQERLQEIKDATSGITGTDEKSLAKYGAAAEELLFNNLKSDLSSAKDRTDVEQAWYEYFQRGSGFKDDYARDGYVSTDALERQAARGMAASAQNLVNNEAPGEFSMQFEDALGENYDKLCGKGCKWKDDGDGKMTIDELYKGEPVDSDDPAKSNRIVDSEDFPEDGKALEESFDDTMEGFNEGIAESIAAEKAKAKIKARSDNEGRVNPARTQADHYANNVAAGQVFMMIRSELESRSDLAGTEYSGDPKFKMNEDGEMTAVFDHGKPTKLGMSCRNNDGSACQLLDPKEIDQLTGEPKSCAETGCEDGGMINPVGGEGDGPVGSTFRYSLVDVRDWNDETGQWEQRESLVGGTVIDWVRGGPISQFIKGLSNAAGWRCKSCSEAAETFGYYTNPGARFTELLCGLDSASKHVGDSFAISLSGGPSQAWVAGEVVKTGNICGSLTDAAAKKKCKANLTIAPYVYKIQAYVNAQEVEMKFQICVTKKKNSCDVGNAYPLLRYNGEPTPRLLDPGQSKEDEERYGPPVLDWHGAYTKIAPGTKYYKYICIRFSNDDKVSRYITLDDKYLCNKMPLTEDVSPYNPDRRQWEGVAKSEFAQPGYEGLEYMDPGELGDYEGSSASRQSDFAMGSGWMIE